MKLFLLILLFAAGAFYYFVPYETKVEWFEKVGIDSEYVPQEIVEEAPKGPAVVMKFNANNTAQHTGNLYDGKLMDDISIVTGFGSQCILDEDKKTKFNGYTVLHRILLLKNKNIKITLTPETQGQEISMFVYKVNAGDQTIPPETINAWDCKTNTNYTGARVIEMTGNSAPSDIVIGISGANGGRAGGYTLDLEQK